jgi:hypothetical protein
VILGVFTDPARSDEPVKNIPLILIYYFYHAAPRIENPRAKPMPKLAQV